MHILTWLVTLQPPATWVGKLIIHAAAAGQLESVKWLHSQWCQISTAAGLAAIKHHDVLAWLLDQGMPQVGTTHPLFSKSRKEKAYHLHLPLYGRKLRRFVLLLAWCPRSTGRDGQLIAYRLWGMNLPIMARHACGR